MWRGILMWRSYHHMNGGGEGSPPMRRPWREGAPPSSYKRPPIPSFIHTPPCEGSLSPSRIIPPWSRISEIHVPGGISSGRSCCFRWIAGARRWRLSGGLNVCASADALLSCGARTSSQSWDRQVYDYINHEFLLVNKTCCLRGSVLHGCMSTRLLCT